MKNCDLLAKTFESRGYAPAGIKEQIQKAMKTSRNELLQEKTKTPSKRIPLSIKYNRTLPSVRHIINKHWNILQLDKKVKETFKERPILAFRHNKNLKDYIGSNKIENNIKVSYSTKTNEIKSCQPCLARSGNLCCQQVKSTSSFKSDITHKTYDIFHNSNCKSQNLIYLMECKLCKGKQYVGKSEKRMNTRINTHRNEVWRTEGPPCDKHFQLPNHDFTRHAVFTIIEVIEKPPTDKLELRKLLEHEEDKWMARLRTKNPDGLNVRFNHPQDITTIIK